MLAQLRSSLRIANPDAKIGVRRAEAEIEQQPVAILLAQRVAIGAESR